MTDAAINNTIQTLSDFSDPEDQFYRRSGTAKKYARNDEMFLNDTSQRQAKNERVCKWIYDIMECLLSL